MARRRIEGGKTMLMVSAAPAAIEPSAVAPLGDSPSADDEPAAPETAPDRTEPKEEIMDTTETAAAKPADLMGGIEAQFADAMAKGSTLFAEMSDLARGNVEAVVESGRLLAAGVQDMSRSYAEESRAAFDALTADMKDMAGVRSPAELMQLQGQIMRRHFELMMSHTSRNADAALKLANDVIAPLSGRVAVASEKMAKVA